MNWVSQGEGGFCCLLCGGDSSKFALRMSEILSLSESHTRKASVHLGHITNMRQIFVHENLPFAFPVNFLHIFRDTSLVWLSGRFCEKHCIKPSMSHSIQRDPIRIGHHFVCLRFVCPMDRGLTRFGPPVVLRNYRLFNIQFTTLRLM